MSKLEKEVLQQVRKSLESWQITKVVIWYERLQSGMVRKGAHYVRMCAPGTPDFISIYRKLDGNVGVLFIECKSDTGKLRTDQIKFKYKFCKGELDFMVCTDVSQVNSFFNTNGIDYVKDISI